MWTRLDPAAQPDIRLNYLSKQADCDVAVKAVRQARQVMTARHLARYGPQEILPGPAVQSDNELLLAIGNIATTIFHPVGTCRMGTDDRAVVGADLRVHGDERPSRGRCLDAPGYRLRIPAIAKGFSSIAARSGVSRAGWFARAENSLLT